MSIVEPPFGIIYRATNRVNGKVYVGQTTDTLRRRIVTHKSGAKRTNLSNHFHNAIRKYGLEQFIWEIIDNARSMEELNNKEIYWISHYRATEPEIGYNSQPGGKNRSHNKATREKLSASLLALYRNGLVSAVKGKHHTEETKQYLSETRKRLFLEGKLKVHNLGQPMLKEDRLKLSKAAKLKYANRKEPLFRNNSHVKKENGRIVATQVRCVETGVTYKSIASAAREYDVSPSAISNVIREKIRTAAGFHWVKIKNSLESGVTTQSAAAS